MIHGGSTFSQSEMPATGEAYTSYQGSLLIAMPTLGDASFAHSVIYLCRHDPLHGMGIILNQPISGLDFRVMLRELNIPEGGALRNPVLAGQNIFRGGPVQMDRGFVLHSLDFQIEDATLPLTPPAGEDGDPVGLTASRDILVALSQGQGPRHSLIALGYAGWGPGQLEAELAQNAWIVAPATHDLLFGGDSENLWTRAMASLGVDPAHLSGTAGTA